MEVKMTEIFGLEPEYKERLNSHALRHFNDWQGRILSRVPPLQQLSEDQVMKDLATYLDENRTVEFQKCLADIRQWLSECMDTGDRYNPYAYATWVVTTLSRVEQLVAKAYHAKEAGRPQGESFGHQAEHSVLLLSGLEKSLQPQPVLVRYRRKIIVVIIAKNHGGSPR
jgi:hypothetical protein